MRLIVEVLPLSSTGFVPPHLAIFRASRKFALPVEPDQTFEQVWRNIEQRYKDNYLDPSQAAHFTIKKLQDGYDCDLDLRDTVHSIFGGESDPHKILVKVVQGFIDRDVSMPPTSHLRPQYTQKRLRVVEELNGKKRRRIGEMTYAPATADITPDLPYPSTESDQHAHAPPDGVQRTRQSPRRSKSKSLVYVGGSTVQGTTGDDAFRVVKMESPELGHADVREIPETDESDAEPRSGHHRTVDPPAAGKERPFLKPSLPASKTPDPRRSSVRQSTLVESLRTSERLGKAQSIASPGERSASIMRGGSPMHANKVLKILHRQQSSEDADQPARNPVASTPEVPSTTGPRPSSKTAAQRTQTARFVSTANRTPTSAPAPVQEVSSMSRTGSTGETQHRASTGDIEGRDKTPKSRLRHPKARRSPPSQSKSPLSRSGTSQVSPTATSSVHDEAGLSVKGPRTDRTSCSACRKRHRKCDGTVRSCQNWRKPGRQSKDGVLPTFFDTTVRAPPVRAQTHKSATVIVDESRDIASKPDGGSSQYSNHTDGAKGADVSARVGMTQEQIGPGPDHSSQDILPDASPENHQRGPLRPPAHSTSRTPHAVAEVSRAAPVTDRFTRRSHDRSSIAEYSESCSGDRLVPALPEKCSTETAGLDSRSQFLATTTTDDNNQRLDEAEQSNTLSTSTMDNGSSPQALSAHDRTATPQAPGSPGQTNLDLSSNLAQIHNSPPATGVPPSGQGATMGRRVVRRRISFGDTLSESGSEAVEAALEDAGLEEASESGDDGESINSSAGSDSSGDEQEQTDDDDDDADMAGAGEDDSQQMDGALSTGANGEGEDRVMEKSDAGDAAQGSAPLPSSPPVFITPAPKPRVISTSRVPLPQNLQAIDKAGSTSKSQPLGTGPSRTQRNARGWNGIPSLSQQLDDLKSSQSNARTRARKTETDTKAKISQVFGTKRYQNAGRLPKRLDLNSNGTNESDEESSSSSESSSESEGEKEKENERNQGKRGRAKEVDLPECSVA